MSTTEERLAMLQAEITHLRARLAQLAGVAGAETQRTNLFRDLVYAVATSKALQRKRSQQPAPALHQRVVNQIDQHVRP